MNRSRHIGPALVVVGSSIAATPASALELGNLTVQSALGQPLRASIAYALGPNETIADTCVTVQRSQTGAVPSVAGVSTAVASGVITVSGSAAVREPVVSLRVSVRCPYTPRLAREYLLFVDPPEFAAAPVEAPTPRRVASRPTLVAPPLARPVSREPISPAARYLVQPGDSLSRIAQRVDDRGAGWREISAAIFAANPDAFLGNDPNRLKAGSRLTIPAGGDFSTEAAAPVETRPAYEPPVSEPIESPAAGTVYEPEDAQPQPATTEPVAELIDEIPEPEPVAPQDELRPGDIIVDATIAIPDTRIEPAPETRSTSPNGSIAIIRQPAREEASGTNWLLWVGGGIVALLGLLFLGRAIRNQFGSTPIAPAKPVAKSAVEETQRVEAIGDVDIDFGTGSLIEDDSPTAENLQLDADLIVGTGLSESADVDVATDFSFAATTELDLELTEEMSKETAAAPTDIIPPIMADENDILESEVLPENDEAPTEDDDEYDMSVIIDATKMPDPSDVTERDLEAIAVDDGDDTLITDDYTISQDVDYKVLEQDYEDELTATQALNEEIQKAAEDLALNLDAAEKTLNDTGINAHGSVEDLDVTAQMPANDDPGLGDDDDTGINPKLDMNTAGDTVEMPSKGKKTG